MNTPKLPPLPANLLHVVRRIRACKGEIAAQFVFEHALNEYAVAAIQAQAVPDGWRPIETAPKDGTMFICWVSAVRHGETEEGQQYQQDASQVDFCAWRSGPIDIQDCGYFDAFCGQIGDEQAVTHWMPLPAAPGASAPPAPQASASEAAACAERDKRIAELEAERDQWKDDAINGGNAQYLGEKVAELERQLEESRKDAERYRWLKDRERWASVVVDFDCSSVYERHRVVWHCEDGWSTAEGQSIDEAIDAAIRAMKEQP